MPIANRKAAALKSSFNSQDISNQCTGLRQVFSCKPFQKSSLMVFWNGIVQRIGSEITILNNSTFQTSFVPESTDTLYIIFFRL